ncbi:hypothetical protein FRC17_000977, partial [Serendipita sp. 399]
MNNAGPQGESLNTPARIDDLCHMLTRIRSCAPVPSAHSPSARPPLPSILDVQHPKQVHVVPPNAPPAGAAVGQGGQNNANIAPPNGPPAGAAVGQGVQNNANIVPPNIPPAGGPVGQGGHDNAAATPANAHEE